MMRNGYAVLASMFLSLWALQGMAQGENTTFTWKFEEANKLTEEKFHNQAAEIWQELLQTQPENSNLNWKLGYAYMNSYNQKQKALPFLEKAAEKRAGGYGGFNMAGYDPFDPAEKNAPVEVDYWLASAYHLNGQFDKADEFYRKFAADSNIKFD